MAKESVFDKEWVDERDKDNLEGLLEQLNVPPTVISFIQQNKRMVQLCCGLLIVAVIAWSFYGSYRKDRIEQANSALSVALNMDQSEVLDGLAEVEKEYSGTDAALWAEILTAQELSSSGKLQEAKSRFDTLLAENPGSSSLTPLLIFASAQAGESLGQYPDATMQYEKLKETEGYQELGFSGLARIYEIQGLGDKALAIYLEHIGYLKDKGIAGQTALIEEKIARIKAQE